MKDSPEQPKSIEELIKIIDEGAQLQYTFFWGHRQKRKSEVDKSCFSNWYPAAFKVGEHVYPTAEHYMMAAKARLFGDDEIFEQVFASDSPADAKSLGRKIRGFDESKWLENRFDIVVAGNLEKFSQNPDLKRFLVSTGTDILAEASPVDQIWGIGLASDADEIGDPKRWKGLNLLGFALMEVREKLKQV